MISRVGIALLGLVFSLAASAASAQTLQRLTVTSFTLAADTNSPKLEVPFHLLVTVHVRERVSELDNLNLPILAELELLGDERRLTSDPSGTLYRETIAVVAHHTGDITIAPATLSAIDARDGRGKRYFSNALTVHVSGGVLAPLHAAQSAVGTALVWVARILAALLGFACVAIVFALLFKRRKAPLVESMPPAVVAPTSVPPDPREQLREALRALRADPTRATIVATRSVARRMVGATDGETLYDVLHRPLSADPSLADVLRTLERAAFTYDADLDGAITAAIHALERAIA